MPTDQLILFYISYVAVWILVILQGLVLLGLVRIVYQLQHTVGTAGVSEGGSKVGLKSGQIAPTFSAVTLSGALISSSDFTGRAVALLFLSTNCPSCVVTLYEMEALNYKVQGNVIVICRAKREECRRLAENHKLNATLVADEDEQISRLFGISSVPTAVLINESGHIQSYGYPERKELEEMLEGSSEYEETPEAEIVVQPAVQEVKR